MSASIRIRIFTQNLRAVFNHAPPYSFLTINHINASIHLLINAIALQSLNKNYISNQQSPQTTVNGSKADKPSSSKIIELPPLIHLHQIHCCTCEPRTAAAAADSKVLFARARRCRNFSWNAGK